MIYSQVFSWVLSSSLPDFVYDCFLWSVHNLLWATPSAAGPRSLPIALWSQILGIVASGSWHSWCLNLSVGMLGCFTLASWGTLGDLGTLGSTRKDTLGSRLGFYCFLVDLGTLFWKCFWYFGQKHGYVVMFVSVFFFLMAFGFESESILQRRYCKNKLSQKLAFSWFQGPFFLILCCLWG